MKDSTQDKPTLPVRSQVVYRRDVQTVTLCKEKEFLVILLEQVACVDVRELISLLFY